MLRDARDVLDQNLIIKLKKTPIITGFWDTAVQLDDFVDDHGWQAPVRSPCRSRSRTQSKFDLLPHSLMCLAGNIKVVAAADFNFESAAI